MSRKANRFKVMGGLLVVAMGLFAVFAGQASAFTWTTKETMKPGSMAIAVALPSGGSTVLKGTVSGEPVELTAKKLTGVETKLVQTGEGAAGVATITGQLKFEEISLQKPEGCSPPTAVTTRALVGTLSEQAGLASGAGLLIKPSSTASEEAERLFATVTLTGKCGISGTIIKVTIPKGGAFCGETEPLKTMLVAEPIRTSKAISEKCGSKLEAGGNEATLTGSALGTSVPDPGQSWGGSPSGE